MNKHNTTMTSEDFFDDLALRWDDLYEKKYFYRDRIHVLSRWLERLQRENLMSYSCNPLALDVGCGTGQALYAYVEKKIEVCGIDISDAMVDRALKRGYKKAMKFDGEKIPFGENTFDCAHMFNVIEFVMSPDALLKEICRVMKPNSYFLMTITNYKEIIHRLASLKHLAMGKKNEIKELRYDIVSIEKLLEKSGFCDVNIYMYGIGSTISAPKYRWSFDLTRNTYFGSSIYIEGRKRKLT